MASNGVGRGQMRVNSGSRSPPFVIIGMIVVIAFLSFNYWSVSSTNSALKNDITEMSNKLRKTSLDKLSAEKRNMQLSEEVSMRKTDLNKQKDLYDRKVDETENLQRNHDGLKTEVDSTREKLDKTTAELEQQKRDVQDLQEKVKDIEDYKNRLQKCADHTLDQDNNIANLQKQNTEQKSELEKCQQNSMQTQANNKLSQNKPETNNPPASEGQSHMQQQERFDMNRNNQPDSQTNSTMVHSGTAPLQKVEIPGSANINPPEVAGNKVPDNSITGTGAVVAEKDNNPVQNQPGQNAAGTDQGNVINVNRDNQNPVGTGEGTSSNNIKTGTEGNQESQILDQKNQNATSTANDKEAADQGSRDGVGLAASTTTQDQNKQNTTMVQEEVKQWENKAVGTGQDTAVGTPQDAGTGNVNQASPNQANPNSNAKDQDTSQNGTGEQQEAPNKASQYADGDYKDAKVQENDNNNVAGNSQDTQNPDKANAASVGLDAPNHDNQKPDSETIQNVKGPDSQGVAAGDHDEADRPVNHMTGPNQEVKSQMGEAGIQQQAGKNARSGTDGVHEQYEYQEDQKDADKADKADEIEVNKGNTFQDEVVDGTQDEDENSLTFQKNNGSPNNEEPPKAIRADANVPGIDHMDQDTKLK